jgi:hypothetical protein
MSEVNLSLDDAIRLLGVTFVSGVSSDDIDVLPEATQAAYRVVAEWLDTSGCIVEPALVPEYDASYQAWQTKPYIIRLESDEQTAAGIDQFNELVERLRESGIEI